MLFINKYDLGCRLFIGQESSNRWRFESQFSVKVLIPGIPLFLLWVAQMGDLLGTSYKVIYYNVCCGLCRRGKRRKALALASKTKKLEDKEKSMAASEVGEEAKNCLHVIQNMAIEFSSGGAKNLFMLSGRYFPTVFWTKNCYDIYVNKLLIGPKQVFSQFAS